MADLSPLRRRMIEDMTIRKFAPKTQHPTSEGFEVQSLFWPIARPGASKTSAAISCIW